jgi:hypothetical protein
MADAFYYPKIHRMVIHLAERRMFAKSIIDSDAFLDMPSTARLLYYDLGMRADDDGFVNAPKKIMRMTGATDGDMRQLFENKFVIPFDNGIVVIKHWRINNYIRSDRYHETNYKKEKESLGIDENGAYTQNGKFGIPGGSQVVGSRETEVRLGNSKDTNMSDFFEKIWSMYPKKEGKGKISDTKKKDLLKLGDEITRAIERYKKKIETKKIEMRYVQMGSSFFNSGYVDYLDENYTEPEKESKYQDLNDYDPYAL